jgi:hypothetical protein
MTTLTVGEQLLAACGAKFDEIFSTGTEVDYGRAVADLRAVEAEIVTTEVDTRLETIQAQIKADCAATIADSKANTRALIQKMLDNPALSAGSRQVWLNQLAALGE